MRRLQSREAILSAAPLLVMFGCGPSVQVTQDQGGTAPPDQARTVSLKLKSCVSTGMHYTHEPPIPDPSESVTLNGTVMVMTKCDKAVATGNLSESYHCEIAMDPDATALLAQSAAYLHVREQFVMPAISNTDFSNTASLIAQARVRVDTSSGSIPIGELRQSGVSLGIPSVPISPTLRATTVAIPAGAELTGVTFELPFTCQVGMALTRPFANYAPSLKLESIKLSTSPSFQ